MATPVVSLPVPAVVGNANRGFTGPGTGSPLPIGAFTKSRNAASGCDEYKLAAFAVSITDPPPTATKASARKRFASSMAAANDVSVGSTRQDAKTDSRPDEGVKPADASESSARATGPRGPSAARLGSVNSSTRRAPLEATSAPISRVTPEPKRIVEVATSKA